MPTLLVLIDFKNAQKNKEKEPKKSAFKLSSDPKPNLSFIEQLFLKMDGTVLNIVAAL